MSSTEGDFVPPPEAPVFRPTPEEFKDPLGYINKIRRVAQRSGICKIIPPPEWNPPFCVDVDNFRFTPRIQRLNELEAKTRIKLNFLDHLAKFWELQGMPLKIPLVDKKYLDLHSLHKAVSDDSSSTTPGAGGDACDRNWAKIAIRLGYPSGKGIGNILRQHYEKILYPYDLFLVNQREGINLSGSKKENADGTKSEMDSKASIKMDGKYGSHMTESKFKVSACSRAKNGNKMTVETKQVDLKTNDSNIPTVSKSDDDSNDSKSSSVKSKFSTGDHEGGRVGAEMRRLQYYGAGPKAAVPSSEFLTDDTNLSIGPFSKLTRMKTRIRGNANGCNDPGLVCQTCGVDGDSDSLLICDGCDASFHLFCLVPPLEEPPHGDWRCPPCVAVECQKPTEVYGFEQAKREYTLQSFGVMADKFKQDYFGMPIHMVPCSAVEKEFWRLVNCIEEDVVVEYGADIHASDGGSGFPTKTSVERIQEDEEHYITAGWNLNNLPNLPESVLQYVHVDISGMKVPWCYVGMCFASFAWHIEDHWSYSINYLHWGEPKTWYGVPGSKAELFEECMRSNAPELFEQSPDLLHQLTTIMNPNTLMEFGVPIVRTNQHAGEYVVTFPRAYHSGFNQGYNFAEAVNFCPADWLPLGRICVDHYRALKRQCVFSHEELVCKMSAEPDQLGHMIASMVHQDLLAMVESEKRMRKSLLDLGVTEAEKEAFELLPDDERQCEYCKTTCFFSAVTCSCTDERLVCVRHADKLCHCPPTRLCLRYRYTLDELLGLLHRVKVVEQDFDEWVTHAREAMGARGDDRRDTEDFRRMISEYRKRLYPPSALLDALVSVTEEAERCSVVAAEILRTNRAMIENTAELSGKESSDKTSAEQKSLPSLEIDRGESEQLTIQQLGEFCEQIDSLPCSVPEGPALRQLLARVTLFRAEVVRASEVDPPEPDNIRRLLAEGATVWIGIPELRRLARRLPSDERRTLRRRKSAEDLISVSAQLPGLPLKRRVRNNSAGASGEKIRRKREKRTRGSGMPGSKRSPDGDVILMDDAKDEEEEEFCSADRCFKPTDTEVEWVQCDRCELWFHFLCIGLDRADIGENEDYVCRQCKENSVGDPANSSDVPSLGSKPTVVEATISPSVTKSKCDTDTMSTMSAIDISDSESEGASGDDILEDWYEERPLVEEGEEGGEDIFIVTLPDVVAVGSEGEYESAMGVGHGKFEDVILVE